MNKRSLLLLGLTALLISSCTVGSRQVVTQSRKVTDFDRVVFEGLGALTISQGEQESLTIEAESNVIGRITTEVKGGTLYIGMRSGPFGVSVVPTKQIKYDLTVKNIQAVDHSGLGSIRAGGIVADRLELNLSGGGDIVIRSLRADLFVLDLSGIGNCELSGEVRRQEVDLSGGGNYNGADLESEKAEVRVAGLGKATVWATDALDVEITGAGNVEYYGEPTVTQTVTGLGRVRSLGQR